MAHTGPTARLVGALSVPLSKRYVDCWSIGIEGRRRKPRLQLLADEILAGHRHRWCLRIDDEDILRGG